MPGRTTPNGHGWHRSNGERDAIDGCPRHARGASSPSAGSGYLFPDRFHAESERDRSGSPSGVQGASMVSVTDPCLDRAMEIVQSEIDILTAERDAFDDFLARLADISTDHLDVSPTDVGTAGATVVDQSQPTSNLEAVRTAYRETVMAVPHYESEYGESFVEHLGAEVDATLASQIAHGTVLTEPVLAALRAATEDGRSNRHDLIAELQRERDSLTQVVSTLTEIERQTHRIGTQLPADTQDSLGAELTALETRCADLANTRQQTIHGRAATAWSGVDEDSLLRYLYADLETETPALSAIGSCLATIRRHQRQL